MKEVYVSDLTYALGEERYSVEESEKAGRIFSPASILKEAGFSFHYICHPATTAYDLARNAVELIRPALGKIETIIYSTCIPSNANLGKYKDFEQKRDVKHLMEFPASHLQSDFRLENAWVIGLNQQACTGMIGSLRLAHSLILAESMNRILCLTSDRFPKSALYEQSYNLISDSAAGCIVSTSPGPYKLLACHGITNGAMALVSDDEVVGAYFNYTHRLIYETLSKARIKIQDVCWIVAQNMNINAWKILAKLLPFNYEHVAFPTLGEAAHLISGDNIVNLKRMTDEKKIRNGELVLLVMAGFGLNWQAALLEKTDHD